MKPEPVLDDNQDGGTLQPPWSHPVSPSVSPPVSPPVSPSVSPPVSPSVSSPVSLPTLEYAHLWTTAAGCPPVFDPQYNPVCLTHQEVWMAMNLPLSAMAQIIMALDACDALAAGGGSLEAAHNAYANDQLSGESLFFPCRDFFASIIFQVELQVVLAHFFFHSYSKMNPSYKRFVKTGIRKD